MSQLAFNEKDAALEPVEGGKLYQHTFVSNGYEFTDASSNTYKALIAIQLVSSDGTTGTSVGPKDFLNGTGTKNFACSGYVVDSANSVIPVSWAQINADGTKLILKIADTSGTPIYINVERAYASSDFAHTVAEIK